MSTLSTLVNTESTHSNMQSRQHYQHLAIQHQHTSTLSLHLIEFYQYLSLFVSSVNKFNISNTFNTGLRKIQEFFQLMSTLSTLVNTESTHSNMHQYCHTAWVVQNLSLFVSVNTALILTLPSYLFKMLLNELLVFMPISLIGQTIWPVFQVFITRFKNLDLK